MTEGSRSLLKTPNIIKTVIEMYFLASATRTHRFIISAGSHKKHCQAIALRALMPGHRIIQPSRSKVLETHEAWPSNKFSDGYLLTYLQYGTLLYC